MLPKMARSCANFWRCNVPHFFVMTVICGLVTINVASAQTGGLGRTPPPSPPPSPGGVVQRPLPAPYHATCTAPPTSCNITANSDIAPGLDCWCDVGNNNYIPGLTHK